VCINKIFLIHRFSLPLLVETKAVSLAKDLKALVFTKPQFSGFIFFLTSDPFLTDDSMRCLCELFSKKAFYHYEEKYGEKKKIYATLI
jgi:hypothetical protein